MAGLKFKFLITGTENNLKPVMPLSMVIRVMALLRVK